MGEKRFELDRIGIFDNKTNHFYYKTFDNEDVVALLNRLADENEQLQKLLNEAEDLIESRLAEHYVKQYRNIKESIVNE